MKARPERQAAKEVDRLMDESPVSTIREAFVGQSVIRPALRALAESVAVPAAVPASKAYFDIYLASLAKTVALAASLPSIRKRKKRRLPATNPPAEPKSVHIVADGNKLRVCEVCKCKVKHKNLAKHQAKSHPGWTSATCPSDSTPPSDVLAVKKLPSSKKPTPQKDPGVPCPKGCGSTIWPDYMETHLARHHAPKPLAEVPSWPTDAFPFELLPPGVKELWLAIERKRKRSHAHPYSLSGRQLDINRFEQIELLNPVKRHVGEKSWWGYVAFEFAGTSKVVLECPFEGNAVYILPGDWMKMIQLNKAEIRSEYEDRCTRVFHTGNWIHRVHKAL